MWVLVTPRSARRKTTGFDVMDEPRSAWTVSVPGSIASLAHFADEPFGEGGSFGMSDHPADDVSAEDIEDDVRVEVGPFGRAAELGDIPGPDFVGSGSDELGLRVARVSELVAALANLLVVVQDSVHGSG